MLINFHSEVYSSHGVFFWQAISKSISKTLTLITCELGRSKEKTDHIVVLKNFMLKYIYAMYANGYISMNHRLYRFIKHPKQQLQSSIYEKKNNEILIFHTILYCSNICCQGQSKLTWLPVLKTVKQSA